MPSNGTWAPLLKFQRHFATGSYKGAMFADLTYGFLSELQLSWIMHGPPSPVLFRSNTETVNTVPLLCSKHLHTAKSLSAQYNAAAKFVWAVAEGSPKWKGTYDRLCDLVVRGPGSIPGTTRFSEKYWVWNVVHSASWVQLRSYLEEKVAAPD
jgi:hypothetical protein